ncbi:MAG: hypothetical protein AUH74_04375 [Nitrospirae bacterium 13_1_40CM_4_62_6]|nr:MAG: hypothetical protein AUH74_04375 [Nitrospirae bacterium 13_1_40CM_4_62_6]
MGRESEQVPTWLWVPAQGFLARFPRLLLLMAITALVIPARATGQEAILELLPIRPFSFDVALRQQTFAPDDREITSLKSLFKNRLKVISNNVTFRTF